MKRIGVLSVGAATGRGMLARRLLRHLQNPAFFHLEEPLVGYGPRVHDGCEVRIPAKDSESRREFVSDMMREVGVLVIIERPEHRWIVEEARSFGCRTVTVTMPEWLEDWECDRYVVHTRYGRDRLLEAGLGDRVRYIPCPLDIEEFPLRAPQKAERFVFVNGYGGTNGRSGWPEVQEALKLRPGLLSVQYQRAFPLPPGTETAGPNPTPLDTYETADVVVRPSRSEGLGLVILEALLAGRPVLTTDGEPMQEHVVEALGGAASDFLVRSRKTATFKPRRIAWPWYEADPQDLVAKVEVLRGAALGGLSLAIRARMKAIHGASAWARMMEALTVW